MQSPQLLILGSGEIARCLASLGDSVGFAVTVCDPDVDQRQWPPRVQLKQQDFIERPCSLADNTHAVIARGHDRDQQALVSLLEHQAGRVYLIASARRAQSIIDQLPKDMAHCHDRLSAPAGLALGGNDSMAIALSIVAEIQMRHHQGSAVALSDSRRQRITAAVEHINSDAACPGKRP